MSRRHGQHRRAGASVARDLDQIGCWLDTVGSTLKVRKVDRIAGAGEGHVEKLALLGIAFPATSEAALVFFTALNRLCI
jgi:hypothetical protein